MTEFTVSYQFLSVVRLRIGEKICFFAVYYHTDIRAVHQNVVYRLNLRVCFLNVIIPARFIACRRNYSVAVEIVSSAGCVSEMHRLDERKVLYCLAAVAKRDIHVEQQFSLVGIRIYRFDFLRAVVPLTAGLQHSPHRHSVIIRERTNLRKLREHHRKFFVGRVLLRVEITRSRQKRHFNFAVNLIEILFLRNIFFPAAVSQIAAAVAERIDV